MHIPGHHIPRYKILRVMQRIGHSPHEFDIYGYCSVFLVADPSKIIFLIKNTIPPKEDRILLMMGQWVP